MEERIAAMREIMSNFSLPPIDETPEPAAPPPVPEIPAVAARPSPAAAPEAPSGPSSTPSSGPSPAPDEKARDVPVDALRPGKFQIRRRLDGEATRALADSIRKRGVLQPIVVRHDGAGGDGYEIVAGERRWRAARIAELDRVPVVVHDLSDREGLEVALVENVQRENLNAMEEARAYRRLIDEFGYNQDALAAAVGKSRSHVANTLRLLALPESVQSMLEDGRLSAGHARALISAPDAEAAARRVAEQGLSVRETEDLVRERAAAQRPVRRAAAGDEAAFAALAERLAAELGLKVKIRHRGPGGRVEIRYRDLAALTALARRLGASDWKPPEAA